MMTLTRKRLVAPLALMSAALTLGHAIPARAGVIATFAEVGDNPITVSSTLVSCSSCIASGASTYNFSAGAEVLAFTAAASSYLDGYDSEPFEALGGSLAITSGSNNLVSGSFSGGAAYAVVGSSSATVEIDLTGASSNVLSLPSGVLYFDITGATPGPVALNGSGDFVIGGLDWTATLSTTPFTPASAVPLPGSLWLLLTGVVGLGLIAHQRRFETG